MHPKWAGFGSAQACARVPEGYKNLFFRSPAFIGFRNGYLGKVRSLEEFSYLYASLLSTALKIPRETGRRKIAKLVNKGLLKLSNRGQVVLSAVKGSTSQTFVENLLPRAKLILTADHEEAVKLVLEDRVQACIADLHICLMYSLLHPDSQLVTTEKPLTYEPLGIAPAGDDPLLTNWVEYFLRLMQGAGEFEKMMGKWLKENVWIGELPPEAVRF